jgi:hypothetical protein
LALVAIAIAAAAITSSAIAGTITQPERLAVKRPRLTAAERRAITLESLSATADSSLGLIVTATFRGNVERYLGQGALAKGQVALILTTSRPASLSAELADEGGGFTATRVPTTTPSSIPTDPRCWSRTTTRVRRSRSQWRRTAATSAMRFPPGP